MAFLSNTSTTSVFPGYVVVNIGFDTWLPWAQGQTYTGALIGIALTPALPSNPFQVQAFGSVPYNVFKLAGGTASSIVAGQTPSRGTTGQLIGTCDISGNISLPGVVVGGSPGGGGGGGGGGGIISGTGLAHVTSSIMDGFAHLGAIATTPFSNGNDYIDTGMSPVLNVKTFGAKGDGSTDDTTAIQNALAAAITQNTTTVGPITLFFPMGIYIISSSLIIDSGGPGSGKQNYLHMVGEVGGHGAFPAVTIRWNGATNATMLTGSNINSVRFFGLNFDGNNLAKCCVNIRPFSTGMKWDKCAFLNVLWYPCWQPSAQIPANTYIVVPQQNLGFFKDQQGTLFKSGGSAGVTGTTQPTFPFSSGGTVSDGTVTWTLVDFSPCTFAVGDQFGTYQNSQVDTSVRRDCTFQGRGAESRSFATTSPAVTFTAVPTPSTAAEIGVIIHVGGALGTAKFTWTINGIVQGGTDVTPLTTAASVTLGNTLITAHFPSGTYAVNDWWMYGQSNAAGFRALSSGNTKQFSFEDCHFIANGVAMDAHHGSGSYTLTSCQFANNQCTLANSGANVICTGLESEGDGYLLFDNLGTAAPATVTIFGASWSGNTPALGNFTNYGNGDAFIHFGGGLTTEGCEWDDTSNQFPLIIIGGAQNTLGSGAGSFRSRGCVFVGKVAYMTGAGELFFPVFDQNTNCYIPGTHQYLAQYLGGGDPVKISSQDDFFTPDAGGINIPISRFDGQDLRLGRQLLAGKFGTNVSYPTLGSVVGACAKFVVPFNAATLAYVSGQTSTITLAKSWGNMIVKRVFVEAKTDFSGGSVTGCTVQVGKISPTSGGTTTTDAYIVASNVFTGVAPAMYGRITADLGASLASPIQGGDFIYTVAPDGSPADTKLWSLIATFTTVGDTPNHLTAGTLNVYVIFEALPTFDPT